MRIGVIRETKDHEFRVGLLPSGVRMLRDAGHEVLVERGAGEGSGFADEEYRRAGARLTSRDETWSAPELLLHVAPCRVKLW